MSKELEQIEGIPLLRRFEKKDGKAVYDLHIKALKHAGTFIETPSLRLEWDKDWKDIEGVYLNSGGDFFVVTVNEKIIGMGALRKIDETTAEIKRMRVEPTLQGRGIGKQILDKLIERARELEYKKLILDVAEKQKTAQHLYETRGFVEWKRGQLEGQETIWYQKEI